MSDIWDGESLTFVLRRASCQYKPNLGQNVESPQFLSDPNLSSEETNLPMTSARAACNGVRNYSIQKHRILAVGLWLFAVRAIVAQEDALKVAYAELVQ
jgi:hypothetical protein